MVTEPTADQFADLDVDEAQLESLVKQLQPDNCISETKYADTDNEVATCATFEVLSGAGRQHVHNHLESATCQTQTFTTDITL